MKTVKINYVDFFFDCDKEHFFVTEAMRKFCTPVISEDPDILFYSCFGRQHTQYPKAVKVYISGENVHADFNECDYAISCQPIHYGNRYLQLPLFHWCADEALLNRRPPDPSEKTRFCNFIYSNANPLHEGAKSRMEFCQLLSQYKSVDCPGKVLHNIDCPELSARDSTNWSQSKINFLRRYKFTIAWENTYGEGYTTEKLAEPFKAGSIPIYCGCIPEGVNPKAIIDINAFDNYHDVIEHIKYLDQNDEAYVQMLLEPPLLPSFRYHWKDELSDFLQQIVDSGFKPRAKSYNQSDSVSLALKQARKDAKLSHKLRKLLGLR